ncbi:ribokinase [Actinotalea sp.]|uniref:ribokinase n=1 Tax=Actinotalea sp. TaxID=1872145 RepID=UPI003561B21B
MDHDIVVVGSVNADLLLEVVRHPHPGETLLGTRSSVLAGGKGANQAVAAARLGASTAMIGAVGSDPYAEVALGELRVAGVDLSQLAVEPGPTGLAVVTVADDGENSIVVIPGANASVSVQAVERASLVIAGARVCVLQAEIPLDAVCRAAELASAAGRRVVLNVAPACTLPVETLRLADPLVVNEHEAAILLGAGTDDSPARSAARLAELGIRSVVITLGAAGVLGVEAGRSWSLPARTVEARDSTGAGDAFVGALAVGLARGNSVEEAALTATRVAAYSVQRLGAQASYPWKDDPLP